MKHTIGIFNDETTLLNAIRNLRKEGVKIHDVFTPFAVHGIEDAMGMRMTRIPVAAFLIGLTAAITAVLTMSWMMGVDWPLNIGGKPMIPLPSFVPPTFEFTVLCTAIGMVVLLFYTCRLIPGTRPHPVDVRATDDKFVIAAEADAKAVQLMKQSGATEVTEQGN